MLSVQLTTIPSTSQLPSDRHFCYANISMSTIRWEAVEKDKTKRKNKKRDYTHTKTWITNLLVFMISHIKFISNKTHEKIYKSKWICLFFPTICQIDDCISGTYSSIISVHYYCFLLSFEEKITATSASDISASIFQSDM